MTSQTTQKIQKYFPNRMTDWRRSQATIRLLSPPFVQTACGSNATGKQLPLCLKEPLPSGSQSVVLSTKVTVKNVQEKSAKFWAKRK